MLDIRTVGLTAGIDLAASPTPSASAAIEAMERAFHEHDLMMRAVGDTLALTPPLIVSEAQIGEIFDKVGQIIKAVA